MAGLLLRAFEQRQVNLHLLPHFSLGNGQRENGESELGEIIGTLTKDENAKLIISDPRELYLWWKGSASEEEKEEVLLLAERG